MLFELESDDEGSEGVAGVNVDPPRNSCTIVIDGFPNTGKEEVAKRLRWLLENAHPGDVSLLRLDLPSEAVFVGGLLQHYSPRSALTIHENYVKGRVDMIKSLRGLRSNWRKLRVALRDPASSNLHTRAHLCSITNTAVRRVGRDRETDIMDLSELPTMREVLSDPPDPYRTLRYYLVTDYEKAVEQHLLLYRQRDREFIRPRAEIFTRALSMEFLRAANGVYCNLEGFPYDPDVDDNPYSPHLPYQDKKLVLHGWDPSWTAHLIKLDVERELRKSPLE